MNYVPKMNRRSFVIGSAAAGGGLAIGFDLFGATEASAQQALSTPELGAWVVVKPDDTIVVRIARSEMGQGTITGLAQLVAEELEADWSKVTYEYPTPGRERQAQARLAIILDRRQPWHPRVARIRPPGRRGGALDAAAGRGE